MKLQHAQSRAITPQLFVLPPAASRSEAAPAFSPRWRQRPHSLLVYRLRERQRTDRCENVAYAVLALAGVGSVIVAIIRGISGG